MNLTDYFLIAMPGIPDPIFGGTVVYMCEHNEFGALGIVINKPLDAKLSDLLEKQNLTVSADASDKVNVPVMFGGPVQGDRGFILHTTDAKFEVSLNISDKIALTSSRDVLEAIAENRGPHHSLVAIGYAGWDAGQLENEISRNSWLTVKADSEMLFNMPIGERYDAAIKMLGFDPALLITPNESTTLQ